MKALNVLMPPIELRLVLPGGAVAVWCNYAILGTLLTQAPPGEWVGIWPGPVDTPVFHRCGGCGEPRTLPVTVQIRRAV